MSPGLVATGVIALALLVVALIMAGTLGVYRRRVRAAGRLAGPGASAAPCVDPANPRAWRALVIDGAGIHLRRTSGHEVNAWPWSTISDAGTGPVRPFAAAIAHQGLHLGLTDGSSVEFLFPSRSTLRYPPEVLDRVMQELARYGKC